MMCSILYSITDALEHGTGVFGLWTSEGLSVIMDLGPLDHPDGLRTWTLDPRTWDLGYPGPGDLDEYSSPSSTPLLHSLRMG
jgi:hypothetical protein